ncbi:hypothetical protein TNCV_978981 [Trichonephila clavipes]|nr:hypothetical protein TNCV_978981 [Trichonephila clavipes]
MLDIFGKCNVKHFSIPHGNVFGLEVERSGLRGLLLVSAKIHYEIGDGGTIADPYTCDVKKRDVEDLDTDVIHLPHPNIQ